MASSPHFDDDHLRQNFVAEVALLTKRKLSVVDVDRIDVRGQRGLIVGDMDRSQCITLLCWRVPANAKEAAQILRAYLWRFGGRKDFGESQQAGLRCRAGARPEALRGWLVRLKAMALGWLWSPFAPGTRQRCLGHGQGEDRGEAATPLGRPHGRGTASSDVAHGVVS